VEILKSFFFNQKHFFYYYLFIFSHLLLVSSFFCKSIQLNIKKLNQIWIKFFLLKTSKFQKTNKNQLCVCGVCRVCRVCRVFAQFGELFRWKKKMTLHLSEIFSYFFVLLNILKFFNSILVTEIKLNLICVFFLLCVTSS
jgi:hypothetical protein